MTIDHQSVLCEEATNLGDVSVDSMIVPLVFNQKNSIAMERLNVYTSRLRECFGLLLQCMQKNVD